MKKQDLIYKDKQFSIYKKGAGELGTFIPMDCLEIIEIAIAQLKEWPNAGFAYKADYEEVLSHIIEQLKLLPVDDEEELKDLNKALDKGERVF